MRMGALYAVVLLVAGTTVAIETQASSAAIRTALDVAELVVTSGAMALWVRMHRAARRAAGRPSA